MEVRNFNNNSNLNFGKGGFVKIDDSFIPKAPEEMGKYAQNLKSKLEDAAANKGLKFTITRAFRPKDRFNPECIAPTNELLIIAQRRRKIKESFSVIPKMRSQALEVGKEINEKFLNNFIQNVQVEKTENVFKYFFKRFSDFLKDIYYKNI